MNISGQEFIQAMSAIGAGIAMIAGVGPRKFRIAFDGAIFSRDEIQSGQFRNALVKDVKNMRRQ